MNNDRKALKSGIFYTISNFIVRSIGIITTPIFARMLTKAQFGAYNNYISWVNIVTIFVTLNLESTLISARYDYEKNFDEYIFSMLSLSTISTVIWLIITKLLHNLFVDLFGMSYWYIIIMLVYLLFLPAINLFQARERYFFEYKRTVAVSLLLSGSTALLSVILVFKMHNRLVGRIYGMVLPTIILGIVFYMYFIAKGKKVRIVYWKYALPICLPYIPHLLSLTLLNSMDRIMITRWCGEEQSALYSLAYTCGTFVNLLMSSLNSAFAPWLGEKLMRGQKEEIRKFSKIYMLCFMLLAVGIMIVAPEMLYFLGGKEYMESKYVMTPVAMGCICQFLYTMFVNIEQFKKKTIGMAVASAIAALINFVLNWVFIPRLGYLAAAYTTLVGYMCLLLIHMYLVRRIKLDDVYSYKFVGLIVCVGMVIMCIITLLYRNWFRYVFMMMYMLMLVYFAIKYKDSLLKLIRGNG